MSLNQSRVGKTEGHLRRPGRSSGSGQYRGGSGGGGGGAAAPPSPISQSFTSSATGAEQPALATNKSFKKSVTGSDSSHSRANAAATVSGANTAAETTLYHASQNDAHAQLSKLSGLPEATGNVKPSDISVSRNASRVVPRAPSSQNAARLSNSSAAPALSKGNASGPFTLQFGTINAGIMNGMQIPARTSSAPPNLDEQKRDQATHELHETVPTSTTSKQQQQQQTKRDVGLSSQSNKGDSHPSPKSNIPIAPSLAPTVASQKSLVYPMSGVSMPIPFQHQPTQVPLQFGRPNLQVQPQGLASSPLQMPMTLPVGGSPQVPQQLLFPGHMLPQQTLIHQGPGLGFAPPIAHQLTPQLGNIGGIAMPSQYVQQQGKFVGGPRKTSVKITDPVTHEEVKFDKKTDLVKDSMSSAQRPQSNVTSQSQHIAAYTPLHQMNYYSPLHANSYNPSHLVFHTPTSVPLTTSQIPTKSQPPRLGYPANQSGNPVSFTSPSMFTAVPGGKTGTRSSLHSVSEMVNLEGSSVSPPSVLVQGAVKPLPSTSYAPSVTTKVPIGKGEVTHILKSGANATSNHERSDITPDSPTQQMLSSSNTVKNAVMSPSTDRTLNDIPPIISIPKTVPDAPLSVPLSPTGVSECVTTGHDERKKEPVRRSSSLKDNQRGSSKKDTKIFQQQQHQLDTSNSYESLKVSSPGIIPETFSGKEFTTNPEGGLPSSILNSDTSLTSLSFNEVKEKISNEIQTSEVVDKKLSASTRAFENEASQEVQIKSAHVFSSSHCASTNKSIPSQDATSLSIDRGLVNIVDPTLSQDGTHTLSGKTDVLCDAPQAFNPLIPSASNLKEVLHVDQSLEKDGGALKNYEKLKLSDHAGGESEELGVSRDLVDSTLVDINKLSIQDKPADMLNTEFSCNSDHPCENFDKEVPSTTDNIAIEHKNTDINGKAFTKSYKAFAESVASQDSVSTETTEKVDLKVPEYSCGVDVANEKISGDISKLKTVSGNKKKKKKEICAKADAAGNSDLYNAYKRTDEKNQIVSSSSRNIDSSVTNDANIPPLDASRNDVAAVGEDAQSKAELDDWEDAADVSTPRLKPEEHIEPDDGGMKQQEGDGNEATGRKYSRDFLLTFARQFTELPMGFEIGSDIAEALMAIAVGKSHADRELHTSPGRITDRPSGRVDRRMAGMMDDDKWTKSGSFGRDHRLEVGHGISVNLRPGQGANPGVLRNSRTQSPNHFAGGILSGPTQGGSDLDRWKRGSQRGLIPSPQTPLQVMHKADKKYEVGKVTDEEQAKQRRLKAILNKLTPQNFEKLFAQVIDVNIDNAVTLTGVISQIFDKALMEPTFCEMYANFCFHLAGALPEISEDNEKITFRRLLLNKCQEEFERGEREQAEASKAEEEGEIKQSKEEREQKRIQARRRMLGNIRLIGELYKKKMLTERIMHECIKKLLGQYQNPDEEDVEALCKLMSTIGEIIDHLKAKEHMDAYFDVILNLSTNQRLSSRVRFMLKDVIDLRRNKWQQRRKVEGPKKIEEVHRDAAQERHAQSSRSGRGPVIHPSSRRGAPVDSGLRGSIPTSSQHIGGNRGLQPQLRGYGSQAARSDDRHQFESRTLSHPLPQRSVDDDSITLGPQGGLATGMAIRQPLILHPPTSEISPSVVNQHRVAVRQNGYNDDDDAASHVVDRVSGGMPEQPNILDRSYSGVRDSRIRDRTFDRCSTTILPAARTSGFFESSQPVHSVAKSCSEDFLKERSMSTIREFYSAKDEGEVALCIKELNASNFYSTMLSLWVTDSFERKDMERDMLLNLIVNLCKSRGGLISQLQLIQGFEQVLFSLEDAVNDAPRAAEFLGKFLAKMIMENVLPFGDIGRLIREGGEEPGRLVEVGLAADVLGNILEFIKLEKGEAVLSEIRSSSSLVLEDFRPSHSGRSKLNAFL